MAFTIGGNSPGIEIMPPLLAHIGEYLYLFLNAIALLVLVFGVVV
jgi:hypothetical protein